jgi:tetratricopeptide (TPR) repeat protein
MATGQLDFALARCLFEESLAIGRDLGDTACVVSALNALAFVARHRGDPAHARTFFEECLELSQEAADERGVVRSLINLGQQILKFDRDPEAAHALYKNALAIAERLNDVAAVAMCLSHLGDVAKARGDPSTAQAMYERAIATFGDLGDRWAVALTLVDLGELFADQGEHQAGHQRFAQALGLAREIGYPSGIARGMEAFARSAARRGQAARALRLAGAAAAIRKMVGAPLFPAEEITLGRDLDHARQTLGTAAAAAEAEGRRMSVEDAIEYALSERLSEVSDDRGGSSHPPIAGS